MLKKLRDIFTPPVFDDHDQNLAARVLYGLVALVFGVTIFLTFPLALILPSGNMSVALQGIVAMIVSGAIYLLVRKGAIRQAGILFVVLFFIVIAVPVLIGGGIRSNMFMNFILLVIAAGLLLGPRAGYITTLVVAVFGLGLSILESNGWTPGVVITQTPLARWMSAVAMMAIVAVLQGISSSLTQTALKEAREARNRYKTLVEQIPAVTYVDNARLNGITEYVSPQVEQMFGSRAREAMTADIHSWVEVLHPEDRDRVYQAYRKSLTEGIPFDMEYRMVVKDGQVVWVHDRAFVIPDEEGNPGWVHGVIFDDTARKQAELEREKLINELETKNAELERFVYTVSHDLKSPIVTIVGFLGYVEDDVAAGNMDAFKRDVDRIYQAAFKMQDLMKDLLELSRIGRMMNTPVSFRFDELVSEAIELTQGRLQERGIAVQIEPELPSVFGDRRRLLEVVQNLIDNAAKYMGDQSQPVIEIGHRGVENAMIVLYVRDNGMGIAPEYHERVFGLFNKLDPNTDGTGIGLALVKRIIEFHGGRIWVESVAGAGSTFLFTLPKND